MRWTLLLIAIFTIQFMGFSQPTEKSQEFNAVLDSVLVQMDLGRFNDVERSLNDARMLIADDPCEKNYFRYKYYLGLLHLKRWELETAEPILLECLKMARASGDSTQLLTSNASMAQLKAEQSLHGASIVYGNEALSYFDGIDSLKYFGLKANIAISYMHEGDMDRSLSYALEAKRFYEREGHYLELGLVLNNIGELYREHFKDYDIAIKHYRSAIEINRANGYLGSLAANYLNMALSFSNQDRIDSAIYYIDLAHVTRKEMGDNGGLAIVNNTLGEIYLRKGDLEAAQKAFAKTVDISREYNIYPGLYYGNLGLGKTYFANGVNNIAREYYEAAMDIASELQSKSMIAEVHGNLYDLHRENSDFEDALNHFDLHKLYSDSIQMKVKDNEFAELKTRYETDLANAENMLLKATQKTQKAELKRQRITSIGLWMLLGFVLAITFILYLGYNRRSESLKKEAALRKELEEQYNTVQKQKEELKKLDDLKNKIFAVLGHDLRAPLTSISSLVSLMNSKDINRKDFEKLTEHLDEETRAGLTSLQSILEWSQVKAGNEKPKIENLPVDPIVGDLLRHNRRQIDEKEVKITINLDTTDTLPADKNQFKSIATNLISNAIKFSPKGGEISIGTFKDSNGAYFTVRDEGEGIPEDIIDKLNNSDKIISRRGTNGEKGTGIGLRIARDFLELHGGHLTFKSKASGGTEVEAFFPFEMQNLKVSA
ncbi:MAG: tetratricopeptide repeat protein [Cryomorphaceae bacterium]|nr:tetratricopeptide repeat protein [Flavobacteriales bacterium]